MPRLSPDRRDAILESVKVLKPAAVYLFGSYGTDRQHPGSDLDLAILTSTPLDPVELFELGNHLAERLHLEVDLVDLDRASTVMRKEVLRTGERLQAADLSAARQFEMLALSDYARLNEERAEILAR
ncbi:nucleotidyltransferase domain-containing protein [Haloferula sp. A504]|uniref:type VII toxin-antitoxin system MntA family adenylyltransferase antitoxin n=1 Tax=Haloferula sp. A504 TaxID=3373601 RepID=UPI0031C95A42|nr:nucleotidyltransferase domain-containing protein [Verrucomicrobiaceae bacterium E54]